MSQIMALSTSEVVLGGMHSALNASISTRAANFTTELCSSSRTSVGMIEAGRGLATVRRLPSGSGSGSRGVKFENRSNASLRKKQISHDAPGIGCFRISSKLLNAVTILSFCNKGIGTTSREHIYTAFATYFENSKVDKITEPKEEVPLDSLRQPRLASNFLDEGDRPKLISVRDFLEQASDYTQAEGPPRWFCSVNAKEYPPDAPLLLFLPGMDSTGLGLLLHQKNLARLFEVQCLLIPLKDRTSFVGLVEIVEKRILEEYERRPGPVYVMGESFGGSVALSVAARNPDLDLVLVIVNPATSFASSPLQPLLPFLERMPDALYRFTPFFLSFTMGDPVKMASASVESNLPPWERIPKVADAMTALLPTLPRLANLVPRGALVWKLKLLSDGARYANSRIRGVKSDMLLLASGKDQMLPSKDEARRLKKLLPQLRIRYFPNSGHTLLLEDGLDVASLIKVSQLLRHKKNSKFSPLRDFRPPFPDEVEAARNRSICLLRQIFSPVFFSINEDGRVQRGLPNIPKGRPLLLVSNHTLVGFDLGFIVDEFLTKKHILLRGLAHPLLSIDADELQESGGSDIFRLFGIVPVNGKNLFELLARGEPTLLYPGGVREALKRKGEKYKLFWSETAEFVRMAIRHGATIIPFASVGGDDIIEILLDTNDLLSLPFISDYIRETTSKIPGARLTGTGEVLEEAFVAPIGYPNIPPRVYFQFRQPIPTEGMLGSIKDKVAVEELYFKVKQEVEAGLEYLVQRRDADPYKNFALRIFYETTNGNQAPTFNI